MSDLDPGVEFTLTRSFDAPRALVFETMSESAHLQKWWGPQGCSIEVIRNEPQPGGVFHYCMRFAPGVEMYGRFDWRELAAPERLVFVSGFADADGARTRNLMSPTWPLEMLTTLVLEEEGEQRTRMTLVSAPLDASEVECQTFKAGHLSMQQGFAGMYGVYEQYLSTLATR